MHVRYQPPVPAISWKRGVVEGVGAAWGVSRNKKNHAWFSHAITRQTGRLWKGIVCSVLRPHDAHFRRACISVEPPYSYEIHARVTSRTRNITTIFACIDTAELVCACGRVLTEIPARLRGRPGHEASDDHQSRHDSTALTAPFDCLALNLHAHTIFARKRVEES